MDKVSAEIIINALHSRIDDLKGEMIRSFKTVNYEIRVLNDGQTKNTVFRWKLYGVIICTNVVLMLGFKAVDVYINKPKHNITKDQNYE